MHKTVILLERETDGIEVSSMGEKVGMRMIPVDQVVFVNVRVPAENIVGSRRHRLFYSCKIFFNEMRIKTSSHGHRYCSGRTG